jgi:hypothetical protein
VASPYNTEPKKEVEMVDTKTLQYLEHSKKLKNLSNEVFIKQQNIAKNIPFGQPILVGHHSENKSRNDIKRMDNLIQKGIELADKAEYWARRAKHRENRLNKQEESFSICQREEKVTIGEKVKARFTNGGSCYEFLGEIVGYTKNEWKVKAIVSPYPEEQTGRIFYIPNMLNRKFSINNCVVKL